MVARALIALASMLTALAAPATDDKAARRAPCTSYTGSVSGNDPDVSFDGTLCEDAKGNVDGTLTWTSKRSGVSVRNVAGKWSSDHTSLAMHDVSFAESKPNPGWMFCLVDRYDLTGDRRSLAGTYHSSQCRDDATVKLAAKP